MHALHADDDARAVVGCGHGRRLARIRYLPEGSRVNELMARADVVLVNNRVFRKKRDFPPSVIHLPPRLNGGIFTVNEVIWPKYLYMKEVPLVFSLSCLSWVAERNVDDLSSILGVSA